MSMFDYNTKPATPLPILVGARAQVAVFERLLPVEHQLVHVPEPALRCGCLCRGGRGEAYGWMLVNLPVKDLRRSEAFFTGLGFEFFGMTDDMASVIISEQEFFTP